MTKRRRHADLDMPRNGATTAWRASPAALQQRALRATRSQSIRSGRPRRWLKWSLRRTREWQHDDRSPPRRRTAARYGFSGPTRMARKMNPSAATSRSTGSNGLAAIGTRPTPVGGCSRTATCSDEFEPDGVDRQGRRGRRAVAVAPVLTGQAHRLAPQSIAPSLKGLDKRTHLRFPLREVDQIAFRRLGNRGLPGETAARTAEDGRFRCSTRRPVNASLISWMFLVKRFLPAISRKP